MNDGTQRKPPPGIFIRDGSLWMDFTLDGRRQRRALGPVDSLTMQEAAKIRALRIAEAIKEGEGLPNPRQRRAATIRELRDAYLETLPPKGSRAEHLKRHMKHILRIIGDLPTDRLSVFVLASYRNRRSSEQIGTKGRTGTISAATINREISTLRRVLNFAKSERISLGREGSIFDRLSRSDRRSVFGRETERVPARVSDEAFSRLLDHLPAQYSRLARFLLLTGMRFNEAAQLDWTAVFETSTPPTVRLVRTKSGKARSVPLSSAALEVLRECPRTGEKVFGCAKHNFGRAWRAARKLVGLEGLRPHDLRHEFCCRAVEAGLDLRALQTVCGWSSLAMVERYSVSSIERTAEILNRIQLRGTIPPREIPQIRAMSSSEGA